MKLIVYRDESGKVINIGEWNYMTEVADGDSLIVHNPIPEGITSKIEEIIINEDGSRSTVDS